MLTSALLRDALDGVGAVLAEQGEAISLVVVGGAALFLTEHHHRTTTVDVDVLAQIKDGRLVDPGPLPARLREAAAQMARLYGLPDDWLNAVVARSWAHRWPPDMPADPLADAQRFDFGSLTVYAAGRRTLIPLKLHAAVDRARAVRFDADGRVAEVSLGTADTQRHLGDLVALAPTDDELADAAVWVRTQDPSPALPVFLDAVARHVRDARP